MTTSNQFMLDQVSRYIEECWQLCVRTQPHDANTLLGLPYPYTVPCIEGDFQELYYWDTFFTTVGLWQSGHTDLVRSNTDNLLYMVDKYGLVPNGNRSFYLNRSQPPFLSTMVRFVFETEGNIEWLKTAYESLKKEYRFWMKRRMTPTGLNRHWQDAKDEDLLGIYRGICGRLKIDPAKITDEAARIQQGAHYMAECETGWDFTPRFARRCGDFVPVDLNSNLYVYETNLAYFSQLLANGEEAVWLERAGQRKALINKFCWQADERVFKDYDWKNQQAGALISAATLYPLWAGLASPEQAASVVSRLPVLEREFGLTTCEPGERSMAYQWDYPNGWPPLQYIAIEGLLRYGYQTEAYRLAHKYVTTVCRCYEATGNLWEKYNVVNGSTQVLAEYDMPTMLGWTAGVFVYAAALVSLDY